MATADLDGANRLALVTGAAGFVGRALCPQLAAAGYRVRCTDIAVPDEFAGDPAWVATGDIAGEVDWAPVLDGVDVVIHLAARVHIMDDPAADPLAAFRRVNVAATERLARAAVAAGVTRFVFASSLHIHGNDNPPDRPFTEESPPQPASPYAVSKWEAEELLRALAAETGLELVVVRPSLVYGPGVRANFLRLMGLAYRGLPLPLGRLDNRRSLVYVENLASFFVRCCRHPDAAGEAFLVSDGDDRSTPDLMRQLGRAMGRPVRLLPFPVGLMVLAASVLGQRALTDRLFNSFTVDIRKARERLGWEPPHAVDAALARTAQWYLEVRQRGEQALTRSAQRYPEDQQHGGQAES